MARFQFLNQHYWPETASTGQHLTDLAEYLVQQGHEVRVRCARSVDAEGLPAARRETRNGVAIERVGASRFGRGKATGRVADYASFHALAGPSLLLDRWADVVITLTTPPMLGLWGSLAQRLGGAKHVCFLMDHHPDAEFESGMLDRSSFLGRALETIYGWTLRSAWHNVALGPYQAQRVLDRGVPDERVSLVPIWSWADEITTTDDQRASLRAELGWSEHFVLLYSGNAGHVHRFDELLEAMRILESERPEVRLAFVGGGPRRAEIERFVDQHALSNVSFHPSQPRERVGALLRAADAHVTTLRAEQVGVSVPGKLYGQLASGRPVLFVGPERCESADDLRASRAGRVIGIGDVDGLVAAVRELVEDDSLRRRLGAQGRRWFLEHRERNVSCEAWLDLLEEVCASARPGLTQAGVHIASSRPSRVAA